MKPTMLDRYIGCLMGGAVGDALGAPVEFTDLEGIRRRFGSAGIRDFAPAYGRRGAITDDTQMTLFTAEGLILSRLRKSAANGKEPATHVYEAYLRWLATQGAENERLLIARHGTCVVVDGILGACRGLHDRRAPGDTCLAALASGRMGTVQTPINDSKGCGGIMRVAPVGLFEGLDRAFDVGCQVAAITHGHPSGFLAAGCLAEIIRRIVDGAELADAVAGARASLAGRAHSGECLAAVDRALSTWASGPASFERVETLGKGWVAEEALAIGIYCALAAEGDFETGIVLAVNHGGDSDSTGAISGNILGVLSGVGGIPSRFTRALELEDLIVEMATDLFEKRGP